MVQKRDLDAPQAVRLHLRSIAQAMGRNDLGQYEKGLRCMTIDETFRAWLDQLADELDWPIEKVAQDVGSHEIENRLVEYPQVCAVLSAEKIDPVEFKKRAGRCWALGSQQDGTRLTQFSTTAGAIDALHLLTRNFPADDALAATRIDEFVEQAIDLGYRHPATNSRFAASAALLASVVLTALHPKRFVDFRQRRWEELAVRLNHEYPRGGSSDYGARLIWAGRFAKEITETPTYRRLWPKGESLWVIGGVCWDAMTPKGMERLRNHRKEDDAEKEYDEGKERMRWHLTRERNRTLVARVKERRLKSDPLLRCDVCRFSFVEFYGDLGTDFIEAHHRVALAELEMGVKTTEEDLALVCANCHRMLHRGEVTLPVEELRAIILSVKTGTIHA